MRGHLTSDEALEYVKNALLICYRAVKGREAESEIAIDTSVDLKTIGDLTANEALVEYLKNLKLPIRLYTEELEKPFSPFPSPQYSMVGDDIDGTHNMKYGLGMLPYGTVIGISDEADPRFKDFIASGFLEYGSGNLFYAVKGKGAYVIRNWIKGGDVAKEIKTSRKEKLDKTLNVIADVYMLGELAKVFLPYVARRGGDFRSTILHVAMVACGACDIFVLGDNCLNPRKKRTGEEIGPGYLLVKEAGGVILDWKGRDLGGERVALHEGKTFHAVVAATQKLGKEFVKEMYKVPEIVEYMEKKGL